MSKAQDELQAYKNAVWAYMLEHCDVLPSGKLFIKFHTDGKLTFEKHVNARFKYGYHREDYETKEKVATEKRQDFVTEKEKKKQQWKNDKKERLVKFNIIKRDMKKLEKENKMHPVRRWFYKTFNL